MIKPRTAEISFRDVEIALEGHRDGVANRLIALLIRSGAPGWDSPAVAAFRRRDVTRQAISAALIEIDRRLLAREQMQKTIENVTRNRIQTRAK